MDSNRSALVTMRRAFAAGVSALGALAVCALAASPAAATFGVPFELSPSGEDASTPQVAVDAQGDAVFTWRSFDGANWLIQARARSAAGVLSPVQTLSSGTQIPSDPQVAVDADGDAVFAWYRRNGAGIFRAQARARSAAGVLSPLQNLSPAGQNAYVPEVAVDADGDAVFTWVRFDGSNLRIQARARSAAGVLSPVQYLSQAGQDAFDLGCVCPRPQVAVRPAGHAVFVWSRSNGANFLAQTRARTAAGVLSAVQTLSQAGRNALDPQVGVDASGDAVFAWTRQEPSADDLIQSRARSAAGALTGIQNVSTAGGEASSPQIGVDTDGDAIFAWTRPDDSFISRVQARARTAAGALSAVQTLSATGWNADSPQVAVDGNGDAVVAWRRPDHIDSVLGHVYVVQARARSASGALTAVQTLSDAERSASSPEVAVNPGGDAIGVWARSDGTDERIEAATGP